MFLLTWQNGDDRNQFSESTQHDSTPTYVVNSYYLFSCWILVRVLWPLCWMSRSAGRPLITAYLALNNFRILFQNSFWILLCFSVSFLNWVSGMSRSSWKLRCRSWKSDDGINGHPCNWCPSRFHPLDVAHWTIFTNSKHCKLSNG